MKDATRDAIEEIIDRDVGRIKAMTERSPDVQLALEDARKLVLYQGALIDGDVHERKTADDDVGKLDEDKLMERAAELTEKIRGRRK